MSGKRKRVGEAKTPQDQKSNTPPSPTTKTKRVVGQLSTKEEVQPWRRIAYCEGNYRKDYPFFDAFLSLFYWHNETLNIWTHLLGWLFFFLWMLHSLSTWLHLPPDERLESATEADEEIIAGGAKTVDRMLYLTVLIAIQIQNLCSVFHHWFGCCDRTTYLITARLDYSAIALLLPTATTAVIYYLHKCSHLVFWIYFSLNLFFAIAVMALCWWPVFQTPAYQPTRAAAFFSLGLFAVLPWVHALFVDPTLASSQAFFNQLGVLVVMSAGVAVYIARYPEKSNPGAWDCCQSHCFWHVFCVFGNIFFCLTFEALFFRSLSLPPCLAVF